MSDLFKGVDLNLYGLSLLLGGRQTTEDFFQLMIKKGTRLKEHPFKLPLGSKPYHEAPDFGAISLIEWPGSSDGSVGAMRTVLKYVVSHYSPGNKALPFLRIIRVKDRGMKKKQENCHFVYFEVANGPHTFLCGGCTDFSGGGGSAREELEHMFQFLSQTCKVKIEVVTLDEDAGAPTSRDMCQLYTNARAELEPA